MSGCCGPGVYFVVPYVGDSDRVRRTIRAAFDLTGTSGLGILYMPGACSCWVILDGLKNAGAFLSGKPVVMTCLHSTLLMCFEVVPTYGKGTCHCGIWSLSRNPLM